MTHGTYHKMGVAAKQARVMEQWREAAVRCPACGVGTDVQSLLGHVRERCAGRPDPHPHAKWVTWAEARALGFSKASLCRATQAGIVRTRGQRKRRELLLRDVVLEIARSLLARIHQ